VSPAVLTTIARAARSELVRSRRRGVVLGWFGLTALAAVLINTVMFQIAGDGTAAAPAGGPGVSFPTAAELADPGGLVAGLAAAANMFGVVTLSFWALITATDYRTGLIRLLVSAQPHRGRLLTGKIAALTLWTAAATTVALIVTLVVAPIAAGGSGIDVTAWGEDLLPTLLVGWVNLFCALLVWGVIGMALAVVTRSAAVAISAGVGYVLVVESVITAAAEDVGDWLPGTTLSALAQGGTPALSHGAALALGAVYTVAGVVVALAVFTRRDITD
jgi:ABC-type transport system involved in multi-copper enzyme maturation permease subunit